MLMPNNRQRLLGALFGQPDGCGGRLREVPFDGRIPQTSIVGWSVSEEEIIEPEWLKLLREAFQKMPSKYGDFYEAATKAKRAFNRELAVAAEERLNTHVQALPQYSLEDKRELAYAVNRELRLLNLCLKCPVTGLPAILLADHGGGRETYSHFRFVANQDGQKLRKGYFQTLPHLDVIEAPPRTERGAHGWKGRTR